VALLSLPAIPFCICRCHALSCAGPFLAR
jgi:hypothetical protein